MPRLMRAFTCFAEGPGFISQWSILFSVINLMMLQLAYHCLQLIKV